MNTKSDSLIIYHDGSARPNKRKKGLVMRSCIVAIEDNTATVIERQEGFGDSLTAEWKALFSALEYAISKDISDIQVYGDSQAVIMMALGYSKTNTEQMTICRETYLDLASQLNSIEFFWVKRDINLAGRFLDSGNGDYFKSGLSSLHNIDDIVVNPVEVPVPNF